MGIQIPDRIWLGMDDAGMGGAEVFGTVTGWVDTGHQQPSAVIVLDAPMSARGPLVGTDELTGRTGSFLLLSQRYVSRTWDEDEGVVQVTLFSRDPHVPTEVGVWIDPRGVYKRRTEITLEWWPDYGAGPLWRSSGRGGAPAELESLALSDGLKNRLRDWNDGYEEEALPIDGPGKPAWLSEGITLLALARKELVGVAVILTTEPWWGETPSEP
ncbi:hypothetical protein E3O44_16685 [Cryobacterium algoricola]|uniref:Uncharacterized protein n=1 Tax=Cryobacterium algoricola TaxID=1259183 RepID=A0ABY2IB50_9MICO|nr:hypothetical protein [Cryobacterium algoricola]TFB84115.1 hypothetical protein E3O44_16685 [Cryobacterium algoricola]